MVLSGESHYANAEPSSNPEDAVAGTVFEITEQELAAADKYEEDAQYRRILVTLRSGDQAWVYLRTARSRTDRPAQNKGCAWRLYLSSSRNSLKHSLIGRFT